MTYSVITTVDTTSGKIYLGNKSRRCRYCLKGSPEVSFSKKAHAIPHFLGNNEIFSYDECNSCNRFFGNGYDDDLSKYLGGRRTLSQIYGKKGIPSYKTKHGLSRIDIKEDGITMISSDGDEIASLDEGSNTVEIKIHQQPYSPLGVYKSLVKMAVALAPQDIIPLLGTTRQWLMRDDFDEYLYFTPFMIDSFIPGPGPMKNQLFAMLLKRSEKANIPSLIFWLSVSNYYFQIVVPCSDLDQNLAGQEVKESLIKSFFHVLPCDVICYIYNNGFYNNNVKRSELGYDFHAFFRCRVHPQKEDHP